tara:strand:- start:42 stop:719 length:678 start_codon:yes stop_codon:yes gene_type:complete
MRLLSTKNVSKSFKDELNQSGISLKEYPMIEIVPIQFKISQVNSALIFTSQNAVNIAFESADILRKIKDKNCFCVGEKTKALLQKRGLNVLKMCQNASDLSNFLVENYKKESFSFFCGKQRMKEIETSLNKYGIALNIYEIYQTNFTSKHFKTYFDGILFFSPTAVSSYFTKNTWPIDTHGFCLGSSTAKRLSQFTSNFSKAKKPSENQLMITIQQYYTECYAKE